jgi:hypothetical protein
MLSELAEATGGTVAVVVVMLLAIGLFGLVVWGLVKMGGADAAKRARLPLDEDEPAAGDGPRGARSDEAGRGDAGDRPDRGGAGDPS